MNNRFKQIIIYLFTVIVVASVWNQADAQSLMQTAKKAEQQAKELKQQENTRYKAIVNTRNLIEYEQFVEDYPSSQNTTEIKRRIEELKLWNKTQNNNSLSAYEYYLYNTKYHWFEKEANEAIREIKQISEKQAWERVVALNTIDAYLHYLNENPGSGYKIEAENAISILRENESWEKIKNSDDIYEIENFIYSFPNSTKITKAKERLHELKGTRYYNGGNYKDAYAEFSQLTKSQISSANKKAYNDVMEYYDFQNLGKYASEGDLYSFMTKYPNGNYNSQVRNKMAIAIASNFGAYSSEYDYNRALEYATDENTKKLINDYIARSKKLKKAKKKEYNSYIRDANGGTFNLGFNFLDAGYNFSKQILYYDLGLILRVGNYNDRLQFAIGINPGFMRYPQQYDDNDFFSDEYRVGNITFHLPIQCQLKLNLFRSSENSRFFLFGKYQYNSIRKKYLEGDFAWGVGCGFAWKHFDWSFFYRKDLGKIENPDFLSHNFWGMSMTYYWQL